jgi:uncharacterized membrane protein
LSLLQICCVNCNKGKKNLCTQASWTPPHHLCMWQKPKKTFEFLRSKLSYKACNIFCKSAVNPFLQISVCRGTTNKKQNSKVLLFCKFLLVCTNIDGSTQHLQSSS